MKKLKKRQRSVPQASLVLERSPSNQQLNIHNGVGNGHSTVILEEESAQPFRGRSKTYTNGGKFCV